MKMHLCSSESPRAQEALGELTRRYSQTRIEDADVIVAVGGDGFMLETLHSTLDVHLPVFGLNLGTVGFLLNENREADLVARIERANALELRPLELRATLADGSVVTALAVNDVSILRDSPQSAHLAIEVDGVPQVDLSADGVLVATSAGSTAYNLAAGGPIIPLGAPMLALTSICAMRPRHWGGALLRSSSVVRVTTLEGEKRPVSVTADGTRFEGVQDVVVRESDDARYTLLFDPGHDLEDRITAQQFGRDAF